jgi:hypothetical protein
MMRNFLSKFGATILLALTMGTIPVMANIDSYSITVPITPTVSTSAYTANYAVGGLQTVNIFRTTQQPSGLLTYVGVNSKGGMTTSIVIYGFRKLPVSTCTDSSAFSFSSTDLPYLIPGFPVTITPSSFE